MASPLPIKRFLILGLLAVFVFVSFASAHYTYEDDDTEPAEGGYGNKDEHRKSPMMDDDEEEEENYRKPVPKKSDHHKGGYDKPMYDNSDSDKPEKDDDGKYDHGAGYGKSEHDDNDDDDDDDEPRGVYHDKPSKHDDEYKGSYGKPKKDKYDDESKHGEYKPASDDDGKQYKGKGPRKEDKGHPQGGYDEPKEGPRGDHKQPKPAPYTPAKVIVPKSISVEGVVSCQDCKYVGGDSLTNAKPVAGAKVKLVCQTGPRYKSFFYATATTDANGFFLISVPHFDFKKFAPVDNCAVFLVSSPLKECSIVTNINMGKNGGPLRPIPTFAPSENLMYSVGPFAFAPKQCSPKPPTGYIPPPAGSHY